MGTHPMNDLLVSELWIDATASVKARLDTPTMRAICNPTGDNKACVYVAGFDDFSADEGPQDKDWGRVVVSPIQTLWPVAEVEGETKKLGILVRTEFNNLKAPAYVPMIGLERSQREAFRQLQRWAPAFDAFDHLVVAFPFYRARAPQDVPQRDDERGLVFLSSEFRTELAGKS